MSTARTRPAYRTAHQGAGRSHRLPRHLSPRLDATFAGIRCTQRTRSMWQAGLASAIMGAVLVGDLTRWAVQRFCYLIVTVSAFIG